MSSQARSRGWFAQIGDGIAAALTGQPEFAAMVLLAFATRYRNGSLAIGLAYLAGAVLTRVAPPRRIAIVLGWIVLAVVNELAAAPEWGGVRQVYAFSAMSFALALLALAWSAGTTALWNIALAGTVASAIALGFEAGASAGAIAASVGVNALLHGLALLLGRQGRFVAAIVLAVLAVAGLTAFVAFAFPDALGAGRLPAWIVGVAGTGVCFLAVVVCGDAARAVVHDDTEDGGASLLVALGRTPWRSTLLVAIVASAPWSAYRAWRTDAPDVASALSTLGGVAAVSALVAGLAMTAGGLYSLLAPLFSVGVLMSISLAVGSPPASASARAATAATWTLVVAAAHVLPLLLFRPALRIGRWDVRLIRGFAALAVLLPVVARACEVASDPAVQTVWIVLVVLSICAAAEGERSAAHVVAGAVMLGMLSCALLAVVPADDSAVPLRSSWLNLPWAWFLGAVTAVVVRRARTITVVPADHPVYTEVVSRP